ncbi:MAG: hypothetical protein ACHQ1H_04505 [Nitrososphaerales archaeon]
MPNDLDEKILLSITEALESIGAGVSSVSYFQFKVETGLDKTAIPRNLELFKTTLSMFFGVGNRFIINAIRAELKKDFQLSYEGGDDLTEIVARIRKNALRKSITS